MRTLISMEFEAVGKDDDECSVVDLGTGAWVARFGS